MIDVDDEVYFDLYSYFGGQIYSSSGSWSMNF